MKIQFAKLTYNAVCKKIKLINQRNDVQKYLNQLEDIKLKLEELKDEYSDNYYSYELYSIMDKNVFKNAAKILTLSCSYSIHNRMLEIGFDNYENNFFHQYTPLSLRDKLIKNSFPNLAQKVEDLMNNRKVLQEKSNSFYNSSKTKDLTLNQEIVSAIFRSDSIINENVELMLDTVLAFVYKKAIVYGQHDMLSSSGIEIADFFNTGCIGYLNSAIFWNPSIGIQNALFTTFGWHSARNLFFKLIYSRRMIKFPSNIESLINETYNKLQSLKLNLMTQNPFLSENEIEYQLAKSIKNNQELSQSIKQIKEIFEIFASPTSALSAYLPREQNLIKLNAVNSETGLEVIDSVPSKNKYTIDEIIDLTLLRNIIENQMNILTIRERIVLKLRYGIKVTKEEWVESNYTETTSFYRINGNASLKTLKEIGELLNVSRETVRVIESKALRKLRNPKISKVLKNFLCDDNSKLNDNLSTKEEYKFLVEKLDKSLFSKYLPQCKSNLMLIDIINLIESKLEANQNAFNLFSDVFNLIQRRIKNISEFDYSFRPNLDQIFNLAITILPETVHNHQLLFALQIIEIVDVELSKQSKLGYDTAKIFKQVHSYFKHNPYILTHLIESESVNIE